MLKQLKSLVIAATLAVTSLTVSSHALAGGGGSFSTDPVIFVHGYAGELYPSDYYYWGGMAANLSVIAKGGYKDKLFYHHWNSITNGVDTVTTAGLTAKIDEVLKSTGAKKVDIVAHSFGGLLVRQWFLENYKAYNTKINRMAMIGTPHQGTNRANLPKLAGELCSIVSSIVSTWQTCKDMKIAASQMLSGSDLITNLNKLENTDRTGIGRTIILASYGDEIVPRDSALGWTNSVGQREGHTYTCTTRGWRKNPIVHMGQLDHIVTAQIVYDHLHFNRQWSIKHDNKELSDACAKDRMLTPPENQSVIDEL